MKRFSALSLVVLLSMSAYPQEKSPISGNQSPPSAGAAATAPEEVRIRALEEQVRTLAEEVALLRGELKTIRDTKPADPTTGTRLLLASTRIEPGVLPSSTSSPAAPVPAPEPQLAQTQTYGGATSNAKLLNPDISLIGDFIGTAGRNTISPSRSLELHESEVGLQAIIDPYARADAFISFGETGVNVEEGYVTFTSLPAGLLLKVGKMRAEFGKVNTIHNHALPFIDRPLVTNNLVGGEDGIDDAGISLSRFLPAPKNSFREPPRSTVATPAMYLRPTAARMSASSAIFVFTATLANRPISISVVPTPGATTLQVLARPSIPQTSSPTFIPLMPLSVGNRSAAPSTTLSSSATNFFGAPATKFPWPTPTSSRPSTLSAFTPTPNTASTAAGHLVAASIAAAALRMPA